MDGGGRQSLWDVVRRGDNDVLAVLGAPGGGRTTLLKHVALQLAGGDPGLPKAVRRMVPILLFLRELPFTDEQVERFIRGWYLATETRRAARRDVGVRDQAAAKATDLLRRIRANPSLIGLAVNPLLLTMIAQWPHPMRGLARAGEFRQDAPAGGG